MNIEVCPKEIFKKLLFVIFSLLLLNVLGIISKVYFDHGNVYGLVGLFNFDEEGNVPTFYSSLALLASSALLSIIAYNHKINESPFLYWFGLAFIFLFLSIDEISSVHEKFTELFRGLFSTSGFLYFAWVIPYGVALVVFLVAYLRFLIRLPKNIMILFVLSGTIFISGAIGFELIGGRHAELYGRQDLTYLIYCTCEELLEMLGIAIFMYTLLTYITDQFESLAIRVTAPRNKENSAVSYSS